VVCEARGVPWTDRLPPWLERLAVVGVDADGTPTQPGTYTIRSRAADDSANLEQPGPGVTVTVV
jgi:hypothetical protein